LNSSEEETENSTRWNAEDETTLTYDDENVHIIYPENYIQSRSKVSESQFYSEGVTEQVTTDNQLSSSTLSSAEQAENFSQYKSAINDPEQKDSTDDKSTVVSSIEISQPLVLGSGLIDTGNPYYAPEEFTYNQDPLELPTIEAEIEPLDTNEIFESRAEFSIRPRGERRADGQSSRKRGGERRVRGQGTSWTSCTMKQALRTSHSSIL